MSKVQLSTTHAPTINFPPNPSLPPATTASKLLASIEEQETSYQLSLNEAYHDLGEKTFKGLRRALPMTRQKLDWERVSKGVTIVLFTEQCPTLSRPRVISSEQSLSQAKVVLTMDHDPLQSRNTVVKVLYFFQCVLPAKRYYPPSRPPIVPESLDCVYASIALSRSSALASRPSTLSSHRYTSYL